MFTRLTDWQLSKLIIASGFSSPRCVYTCAIWVKSGTWLAVSYACGVQMSGNRQESFKNKPHFEDVATDLGPVDIIDLQTPKGIGKASSLESPQRSTYHWDYG